MIGSDDLIEIGSEGVSMKLIHNGDPNRTLAMMIETYEPGTTTGERIKHQGEDRHAAGRRSGAAGQRPELSPVGRAKLRHQYRHPHSFSNTSARICRIISAHTPTTF